MKADKASIPIYTKNTDNMAYNLPELLINNRIGTMTNIFQNPNIKEIFCGHRHIIAGLMWMVIRIVT